MLNPDYHKNEGDSLLSKIIFDCATKAKLSCRISDIMWQSNDIVTLIYVYRMGKLWCACTLNNDKIIIDLRYIGKKLDSRISPKFWYMLVRPDTMRQEVIIDLNDPRAFDDIIELFVALRPIR